MDPDSGSGVLPSIDRAAGAMKIFPLPGVVVLPGSAVPFHVFEPRYRLMVADALAGDRILCVGTLRNDADAMQDRAAVHPVAGAGFLEEAERQPDGRYHVLFRCLERVRLVRELENGKPYREFAVERLEDLYPPAGAAALQGEAEALRQLTLELCQVLPEESGAARLAETAARTRDPSALADLVAGAVAEEVPARLAVLGTADVGQRLSRVMQELSGVLLLLSQGRAPRA
ncbi:MAG: LON peptidase substrate-binding domain-containing protein [Deltaproteobacteria bacterium]|nr:LON peptidase substrate-binding domain-containing protein [Deltaproteobacteria bacterium]